MKKVAIPIVLVIVLAIAAAVYFKHSSSSHASQIAALLPAETVLFLHLPDIQRSGERWGKTALAQIAREPEMQAFLERPKSNLPQQPEFQRRWEQIKRMDPREAFLAITSMANGKPKGLMGFEYHGKKEDVDALVADVRSTAQGQWPAGKSDISKVGGTEIETFAANDQVFALAYHKNWLLAGNDLDGLKATIEHWDNPAGAANSLKESAQFKTSLDNVPREFDALAFVQPQAVVDILAPLLGTMSTPGAAVDSTQFEQLRKIRAIVGALKFEGENIRDTVFMLNPDLKKQEPLKRSALALSATDTMVYSATVLGKTGSFQLPNAALDTTGFLQQIENFLHSIEAQGLSADDFWSTFGPEFSVLGGWPANSMTPSLLAVLDVRDAAKAQRFAQAITQPAVGGPAWTTQSVGGVQYYRQPRASVLFQSDITLAITDRFAIAGLTFDGVADAVQRAKAGDGTGLGKNEKFQTAAAGAITPTDGFAYVDSRALFERLYGTLRPFAMMWGGGSSAYVDLSKLPATETISKHLSPVVYSHANVDGGTRVESVGPVTMSQVVAVAFIGGAATAFSRFEQQFQSGPQQSPGAFPGMSSPPNAVPGSSPQLSLPPASPAPSAVPAAPPY